MAEEDARSPLAPLPGPLEASAAELRQHGRRPESDGKPVAARVAPGEREVGRGLADGPPKNRDPLVRNGRIRDPRRPNSGARAKLPSLAGEVTRPRVGAGPRRPGFVPRCE